MLYKNNYQSPLGSIVLAADEIGLVGLWFEGQKHFSSNSVKDNEEKELPIFEQTKKWLDIYFSGIEPDFKIPLHFTGTEFQNKVWEALCLIPYGKTTTYKDIAKILAEQKGRTQMSAQAVGGAIGRNKISIIIPCHRVIGINGNLTGYAGGIDKKVTLLKIENGYKDSFFLPKKH